MRLISVVEKVSYTTQVRQDWRRGDWITFESGVYLLMAFCSNLIRFRHRSRSQIEFGLNLPEHGDSRRLVQGKPVRSNAFLSSSWRYQGDTYYLLSPDSPPTCIYYPVNSSRRFLFLLANHGSLSFPFRRYAVLVGRSQILLPIYGRVFKLKSSVQNYPLRKKMSPSKTIF